MSRDRTVVEKVADWSEAFEIIKHQLSPEGLRALTVLTTTEGTNPAAVSLGVAAARITFANDRMAAQVAAMLTQSGVSRPIVEDSDGE